MLGLVVRRSKEASMEEFKERQRAMWAAGDFGQEYLVSVIRL